MTERTIYVFAKSGVSITRINGAATNQNDIIGNALNGDAFSWEVPYDLALTFSGPTTAIHFDDSDGYLTDDPFSGATVIDQRLTQSLNINGTTYNPSNETIRWKYPPPVGVENEYEVTLYDAAGHSYRMVGVSITQGYTTQVVGVMFEGDQPPAGTKLYYLQRISSYSGYGQSTPIIDPVTCFLAGTRIETGDGPRPIESLRAGDMVRTLHHGMQPLRWIGHSTVRGIGLNAPVQIAAGIMGNTEALSVSPNHRILLRCAEAELFFGSTEVLVPAKFLIDGQSVRSMPARQVDYLHLLLDRHETVFSNNVATESLFAGQVALDSLDTAAVDELRDLMPGLDLRHHRLSHRSLNRGEAALLLSHLRAGGTGMRLPGIVLSAPPARPRKAA
jgi:hypothetical protein